MGILFAVEFPNNIYYVMFVKCVARKGEKNKRVGTERECQKSINVKLFKGAASWNYLSAAIFLCP